MEKYRVPRNFLKSLWMRLGFWSREPFNHGTFFFNNKKYNCLYLYDISDIEGDFNVKSK